MGDKKKDEERQTSTGCEQRKLEDPLARLSVRCPALVTKLKPASRGKTRNLIIIGANEGGKAGLPSTTDDREFDGARRVFFPLHVAVSMPRTIELTLIPVTGCPSISTFRLRTVQALCPWNLDLLPPISSGEESSTIRSAEPSALPTIFRLRCIQDGPLHKPAPRGSPGRVFSHSSGRSRPIYISRNSRGIETIKSLFTNPVTTGRCSSLPQMDFSSYLGYSEARRALRRITVN